MFGRAVALRIPDEPRLRHGQVGRDAGLAELPQLRRPDRAGPPRAKSAIRANARRNAAVEYCGPREEPSLLNAEYSFQCPFISGMGRTYAGAPKPASAGVQLDEEPVALPLRDPERRHDPPGLDRDHRQRLQLVEQLPQRPWLVPADERLLDRRASARSALLNRFGSPSTPSCVRATWPRWALLRARRHPSRAGRGIRWRRRRAPGQVASPRRT